MNESHVVSRRVVRRRLIYSTDVPDEPTRPTRQPPTPPVIPENSVLRVSGPFRETLAHVSTMVGSERFRSASNALVTAMVRNRRRGRKIDYETVIVDSSKTIGESGKCPICLAEYDQGERCGILPCRHNFHDLCIRTWLDDNQTCPLCRMQLGTQ